MRAISSSARIDLVRAIRYDLARGRRARVDEVKRMRIGAEQGEISSVVTEVIVLGIFKGVREPAGAAGAVDRRLDGALSKILIDGDFRGDRGETFLVRTEGKIPAKRVLLVGLGAAEKFSLDTAREAGAVAVRACGKFSEMSTAVQGAGIGGLATEPAAQALAEGLLLGAYRFWSYRTGAAHREEAIRLETVRVIERDAEKLEAVRAGLERGEKIAAGVCAARDLANEPGLTLTPRELARRAQVMAQTVGLTCAVFDEGRIAAEAMGGLLAVARGSEEPPRFIILEHKTGAKSSGTIVLVGKGITFDSGGLSIKPRDGMGDMKYDMSGGAAVFGAMQAVAALQLPVHVVGLISASENLISGRAIKPGDVIKMLGGKTVEITNTDAEGRLVLGDALVYAQRYQPQAVIDLATLTGACVVALGKEAAGLFSNDESLASQLERASAATGERVWPLPLYDEYREILKSEVADLMNSNLKIQQAGACVGAIFLKEFVDYPWAHLDIAGPAYHVESRRYYQKGATGFGVRLLVEFLSDWSRSDTP